VLGIAAAATVLLLALASRYGYHRDELYFLSASRHLAFGYVDQPPIAVLVAWLARVALGNTLLGLRVIPAVLTGCVVALSGAMARELDGSRFAQAFAALCVASGGLLAVGHLEGPTVYDVFVWVLVSFLVLRILRTGNPRLWLAVGLVVGVGLEAKNTSLMLLAGLAIGFVVNRQGRIFRSPWLWAGAGLAVALWAPNIVWQATHRWPTALMDKNLRAEHSGVGDALQFPFVTFLALGVVAAFVSTAGWWSLWRDRAMRPWRAFAVAFACAFLVLWVVIPGRFYYLFGIYPALIAAGAVVTDEVLGGTRGFFRARPSRRMLWRSRRWAVGLVLGTGIAALPVALPVLPPSAVAGLSLQKANYNLGEEIGWQDFTREVAGVWRSLPSGERASAVILTENYGEAGAIDRYGDAWRLPRAFSGHNSFWSWGPPQPALGVTIAIGFDLADLTPYFDRCTLSARIENHDGVDNDENRQPIFVCTGQRAAWSRIWDDFKHYG
jgi:4-amino-4-deoxy-L-arabinose transferase-like glycosyltransferase